jgi:hypothetical protein
MKGKTVVITGGTSGIGEFAAERLAQMGARIDLIARSKSRGKVSLARLHAKAPDLAHTVHYADLAHSREEVCGRRNRPQGAAHRRPDQRGGNVQQPPRGGCRRHGAGRRRRSCLTRAFWRSAGGSWPFDHECRIGEVNGTDVPH